MFPRNAFLTLSTLALFASLACVPTVAGPKPAKVSEVPQTAQASEDAPIVQLPIESNGFGAAKWFSNVGPNTPPFWVRPGFKVTQVGEQFGEARFMAFDKNGTLYVSQPNAGSIITLKLQSGKFVKAGTFVEGYNLVHGLQIVGDWLWFTTSDGVHKAKIGVNGKAENVQTILDGLPHGGHWWRSILVDSNGFYTSIGDSGNITDLRKSDREKIWHYSIDGQSRTLFASGIRNTEKLMFAPGSQQIYGCDQGSDWFGAPLGDKKGRQPITDFNPPDEFNHYVQDGFYGHPFIVGMRVPRVEFQNSPEILSLAEHTIPPVYCFGPHWAADGWTFIEHSALGKEFEGDALVALHGSWNRKEPAGYRIQRIRMDNIEGEPNGGQMIVGTIGQDKRILARPVDVAVAPDGTVYFSDDMGGRIFKIEKVQ